MTSNRQLPLTPSPAANTLRTNRVIDADGAAALLRSGNRVAVGGSGSLLQVPETILAAIERRWHRESQPQSLDVMHVMGLGDHTGRGLDHLSFEGLVRRFIGSHFVLSPRQQALIASGAVEAIGLPAGTISLMYREIAARRPGLFTDIGIDTFVDPRLEWGSMNAATSEGLSEVVRIADEEWLFYPRLDIDVALIRASEADPSGNLSMDDEGAFSDNLGIAQAARNSGGIVIAEVKRLVEHGSIPASRVRVPGVLVDHIVVTDWPRITPLTIEDPRRTGVDVNQSTTVDPIPLDHRKVVARRAAMELREGMVANLGVGMANGISYVALEEGVLDAVTLTVEQGLFGGLPGVGLESGTAINPGAMIDMASQFDYYDGGGLDFAGLAFAQVGRNGDVNVARVGDVPIGPGGFIDISQKAGTVVFCGTFRGGGLRTNVGDGRLTIDRDGAYPKFVNEVEHVSFSAERALRTGQRILYVTERAVFALTRNGIELREIAPGVNLERDILEHLDFIPAIAADLQLMPAALFDDAPIGLRLQSKSAQTIGATT